eukprot:7045052-Karenia_brevis.AAC.1
MKSDMLCLEVGVECAVGLDQESGTIRRIQGKRGAYQSMRGITAFQGMSVVTSGQFWWQRKGKQG